MSDPEDFDPSDRLFDFAIGDPPYVEPAPGVDVTAEAEILMAEVARVEEARTDIEADATVEVHYLSEVRGLLDDARAIRQHAMRVNPRTQREEIYNPILFEKAVARRQSILAAAVKLHKDLWDQQAQMDFYRLMVSTIAQESPETAHRLIEALRRINSPMAGAVAS